MAKYWRCRRVAGGEMCGELNLGVKKKCHACGKSRPVKRKPAHRAVLVDMPYERCVEIWGESCGICGAGPVTRRLHRDHEHRGSGRVRGLLCFRCNAVLRPYMTLEWCRAAVAYLERDERRAAA